MLTVLYIMIANLVGCVNEMYGNDRAIERKHLFQMDISPELLRSHPAILYAPNHYKATEFSDR